jgi:hypothetical protein
VLRGGGTLKAGLATATVVALLVPAAAQAVTLRPGDLIASFNDPPDSIVKVNPRNGATRVIASGDHLADPWQLSLTRRGRILVADHEDHSILSIDPRDGAQDVVYSDAGFGPVGVGVAASGRVIASDYDAAAIVSINPGTGVVSPIAASPLLDGAAQLALAPSGRVFVPAEGNGNSGVYSVNPQTGGVTPLVTETGDPRIEDPFAATLASNGRVLFADYDFVTAAAEPGALVSIKPSGGPLRLISSGNLFGDPIGLARSFAGPLFVAEQDEPTSGSILRVNAASGAQRRVLDASTAGLSQAAAVSVVPPRCFGRFATIVGGPRADKLTGTRFPDVIAGAGGGDRIRGRGGRDRICGGKGRDRLIGGGGRDRLRGGAGRDLTRQ